MSYRHPHENRRGLVCKLLLQVGGNGAVDLSANTDEQVRSTKLSFPGSMGGLTRDDDPLRDKLIEEHTLLFRTDSLDEPRVLPFGRFFGDSSRH